jgi:hypothetical protein
MKLETKAYDATMTDMLRQQGELAAAFTAYKIQEASYRREWAVTYQGHLRELRKRVNGTNPT